MKNHFPPHDDDHVRATRRLLWFGSAAIFIVTLVAYLPAINAQFIWDDDSYVTTNVLLRDFEGLRRIWIPRQTPQYYPAVFTTFWIEYQLWELNPLGYHLVNVVLHIVNALLVWFLARRIGMSAAFGWFVAVVFALHPVHVESVAWITERKNVLSALFYILSAVAYLRFDESLYETRAKDRLSRLWVTYAGALVLFLLALLSKTVTCSLPAALILILLYQRRRLSMVRLLPLLPFFLLGVFLAINTAAIERDHVLAVGPEFEFSSVERVIIASKALWFYPAKIAWPWPLSFIYPRWNIDPGNVIEYIPLVALLLVAFIAVVIFIRGRRGPAMALAFYAGTVFPALGFFNYYPMRFSFVADHFQYLGSLGVIALLGSLLESTLRKPQRVVLAACILIPILGSLTWIRSISFFNAETVWRDTIAKNESAWMPRNNLATILLRKADFAAARGDHDRAQLFIAEARDHLSQSLSVKPDYDLALTNLAEALRLQGRYEDALLFAHRALDQIENSPDAKSAREQNPRPNSHVLADAWWQVGRLHEHLEDFSEAERCYREAVSWDPGDVSIREELARLMLRLDRLDEAAVEFKSIADLNPRHVNAIGFLGEMAERANQFEEALILYRRGLASAETNEEFIHIGFKLARLLATCEDARYRNGKEAVSLGEELARRARPTSPYILDVLAAAYFEAGDRIKAVGTARAAHNLAVDAGDSGLAISIEQRLESWGEVLPAPDTN